MIGKFNEDRSKFEIRPKNRTTLVGVEIFLLGFIGAFWLKWKLGWDWYTMLVIMFCLQIILFTLFRRVRVFRYIFSILFSLCWGVIAYGISMSFTGFVFARWLTALLVFLCCLFWHKDYFDFES